MKTIVCMILILVLPVACIHAADKDPRGIVLGPGALTCGRYLSDIKQQGSEVQYLQWTFGFVSGLNNAHGADVGVGTDRFAIMKHIDNYCQGHPLDVYADAVLDLYKIISSKKKQQ